MDELKPPRDIVADMIDARFIYSIIKGIKNTKEEILAGTITDADLENVLAHPLIAAKRPAWTKEYAKMCILGSWKK